MADFDLVTKRIAVGAAINSDADVQALLAAGITHVVDCRAEFDDTALLASIGLQCLWIGVQDDGLVKPVGWFKQGIEFGLAAFANPANRIDWHCAAGVNRGPSMCYAFLRALGMDATDAERYIRRVRPQVGLAYRLDADAAVLELGYA